MLDLQRLREQFAGFDAYQADEWQTVQRKVAQAVKALEECHAAWPEVRERLRGRKLPQGGLIAGLKEAPGAAAACLERPTPVTVVAADGSQIYPDRHVEPTCYLLNISRVAFHYGTLERPLMESVPFFQYRRDALEDMLQDVQGSATAQLVSAVRDQLELKELLETARRVKQPDRPMLAMADGTLIRWMLGGMNNKPLEKRLIEQYVEVLAGFQEARVPVCSYISMPRNTEVVNLLRVHAGECEADWKAEQGTLEGLTDRNVFALTLAPGERSAVFEAESHVLAQYGAGSRICYFYVHVSGGAGRTGEIGRVEIPEWVADDSELVAFVHAVVVSECEKGDGYPLILSEAHEQAVIRAQERELFYNLVEGEMVSAGLPHIGSQKALSKRRPMV